MIARITTFAVDGVASRRVWVEADIRQGLPAFTVVGLADKAVREARERVRAALVNSGFEFPLRRITVNLAPADLRKIGPGFDLPLAIALLVAGGELDGGRRRGLRGRRRAVADRRGAGGPRRAGDRRGRAPPRPARGCCCPRSRAREAALVPGARGARRRHASSRPSRSCAARSSRSRPPTSAEPAAEDAPPPLDLADVRGHNALIPALEVAAAGGHNLYLHGPPGTGKTMLARRLPSILPPLTRRRGDRGDADPVRRRPAPRRRARDRAPVPRAAPHDLRLRPGRRRLAAHARARPRSPTTASCSSTSCREFVRSSLEALRQPLEDGHVTIVRGQKVMAFPTRFMLVAASNPCPCGMGDDDCRCTRRRPRPPPPPPVRPAARPDRRADRRRPPAGRGAARRGGAVLRRGPRARGRRPRAPGRPPRAARPRLQRPDVRRGCCASTPTRPRARCALLYELHDRHRLSARGHGRVLRVARTIADLEGSDTVGPEHVILAAGLRLESAALAAAA